MIIHREFLTYWWLFQKQHFLHSGWLEKKEERRRKKKKKEDEQLQLSTISGWPPKDSFYTLLLLFYISCSKCLHVVTALILLHGKTINV